MTEYSAENHDWDLTFRAAWSLLMAGQVPMERQTLAPGEVLAERQFSCFSGSMLLSFCTIESFTASVAFSMPREARFETFDFEKFRQSSRFWGKIEFVFGAIPHAVDKSQGLFQVIGEMQEWRNLVTHASPYEIEETTIPNTTTAPGKLHAPFRTKEYSRRVNVENAKKFYATAFDYVALLKELTGIEPRASATFVL